MTDYVLLFRSNEADRRAHMGTPERAQKSMEAWLGWIRELEAKGALVDRGQPLDPGGRVIRGKDRVVTDGPFVEVKDLVLGFFVVRAKDADEAVALARGCPMLDGEGSVEIRPVGKRP
jgi:hypothetical protein